jgi:hypothetical protein
LLCLVSCRIDAIANWAEMAMTTCQVMGSMINVVKGIDRAMEMVVFEHVRPLLHSPH